MLVAASSAGAPSVPINAVLFDLDDTLVDHSDASRRSTAHVIESDVALAQAGLDAVQAENVRLLEALHLEVAVGQRSADDARVERWRSLLLHFGGNRSRAAELAALARIAYRAHETAVPGAHELLRALTRLGLRLAIVSNNSRAEQLGKLQRLAPGGYFDSVTVSADHGIRKPDPRLFRIALDALGLAPGEAVFVGDSWHNDVAGALAAGIRPIWFNRFAPQAETIFEVTQIAELSATDQVLRSILSGGSCLRQQQCAGPAVNVACT